MRAMLRAPSAVVFVMGRLANAIAWLLVIGIGVFAALLLTVRLVVFPNIERYRDAITRTISSEVHEPVEIDTLATDWDGWNPKLVIGGFRVGARTADGAHALLELPRVSLTLAWTSVLALEPRLKQLVVESPRLSVRRDASGVLHVAGIEIDPARAADDAAFTDWLLRQPEIVVRDALITWVDERRNAPQLVLDRVMFRLESRFGGHRFGLTGNPPAELAAPIDVRGDFVGRSFRNWQEASGEIYARLDYADVAAWREWLPLPLEIESGKGALRGWFTFGEGQLKQIVADVELADVRTRLARELPELALAHVTGRAGWRAERTMREVYCRGLAFTTADGQAFAPTNMRLVMRTSDRGDVEHGQLEVDRIDLKPLRDIAQHLPLPDRWRSELVAYAPQGAVSAADVQWQGPADAPTHFDARAEFARLSWLPRGAIPGATDLTGSIRASSKGGEVKLATRNATVSVPRVLGAPVSLDQLNGAATWTVSAQQVTVHVDETTFANADAAGRLRGTYRRSGTDLGSIDLEASLTRALPQAVPRYVPIFMHEDVRSWIARAIKGGAVDDAKLTLKGDLARFPFADGKSGVFAIDVKGRAFSLDYADRWPPLAGIDGEAHFRGSGLRVDAVRARVHDIAIGRTVAEIADFRTPILTVQGEATGPARDFLRFMEESPVQEWIGDFTRGAQASGDAHLALKLALPLTDAGTHHVAGEFTFLNDQLTLPGVPPLAQVNGKLAFSERDLRGRDITAEALGGPVRIGVMVSDARTRIVATGNANLQTVRREFPFPLAEHVTGSADWSFVMDARGESSSWTVESPLRGVTIDLPAPLGKTAAETRGVRIERRAVANAKDEDTLVGSMGDVARIAGHRRVDRSGAHLDRLVVALGRGARALDTRNIAPGLWIRAELPEFDVDQWLAVRRDGNAGSAQGADELALKGVDIDTPLLSAFGRNFTAMKVNARVVQDEWKLDLAGQEIAGAATWSAPSDAAPNGRIVARLARLTTPAAKPGAAGAHAGASADGASSWPELDVAAESFQSKGRDLGRLELLARPRRGEWRIERLVLANDAGRLEASGAWRAAARNEQTSLEVLLDVKDGGGYLAHFGHAGLVQGAPTKITGQLAWAGDPSEFDYPSLSGSFRMDVGAGRFVKVEPGIGKLLGVLSLQALPRRISLDFRDIFTEGFTFDRVSGNVRIARGVMSSDDLRMVGPSAQIAIAGDTDLAQETQNLRVRVQPTLSAGVSAGAALMFLANPVVGAAVGAGSLLAQKVLRDPIEQIFSYNYVVTGSWSDPHVTRGAAPATQATAKP